MRRWDRDRLLAAVALASWAGMFWFLWLGGRTGLFLSARTAWLVPLGALLATIASAGAFVTARTSRPPTPASGTRVRIGLLLVPVAIVLSMPPVTLGTYAATRRSSFGGLSSAFTPDDFEHGPLTMVHVAAAAASPENLDRLRARAGEEVTLQGFVTREPGSGDDEFLLTRFVITCCVADAATAQVRVVAAPPGATSDGEWVDVTGRIYPLGDEIVLAASDIEPVAEPPSPYLTAY